MSLFNVPEALDVGVVEAHFDSCAFRSPSSHTLYGGLKTRLELSTLLFGAALRTNIDVSDVHAAGRTLPHTDCERAVSPLERLIPGTGRVAPGMKGGGRVAQRFGQPKPLCRTTRERELIHHGSPTARGNHGEGHARSEKNCLMYSHKLDRSNPQGIVQSRFLSRRHLDRLLTASALAPTKNWIVAARAWHVAYLLARRGLSAEAAAARLGYADSKALRRHLDAVWDMSPSQVTGADVDVLLCGAVAFLETREPDPESSTE